MIFTPEYLTFFLEFEGNELEILQTNCNYHPAKNTDIDVIYLAVLEKYATMGTMANA